MQVATGVLIKFLTKPSRLGTFIIDCIDKNCLCHTVLLLYVPCSVHKGRYGESDTLIVPTILAQSQMCQTPVVIHETKPYNKIYYEVLYIYITT